MHISCDGALAWREAYPSVGSPSTAQGSRAQHACQRSCVDAVSASEQVHRRSRAQTRMDAWMGAAEVRAAMFLEALPRLSRPVSRVLCPCRLAVAPAIQHHHHPLQA